MPRRPASVELLAALAKVLRSRKIRWYVFGAQAAIAYGSPRMTMDVDVTVAVPTEGVRPLVEALLGKGFASRATDLEAFFARSRVVPLVHQRTRMPLDLVVARDSLEMAFLDRARPVDIGGLKVPMITAEDLVIAKLFAGRPRDLEDVRAVLGTGAFPLVGHVPMMLQDMLRTLREARDTVGPLFWARGLGSQWILLWT